MVVPCAQLRVFVPTDTLGPRDRERWAPTAAVGRSRARRAEDDAARLRLLTGRWDAADDAVLVRRAGDHEFVCPLQYDLRAAAGLRHLSETLPSTVVAHLLPDEQVRARLEQLALGAGRPFVVDAPWAVPVEWFVLFSDDERRFHDPPEGAGPRVRYLTTVDAALGRVRRAVDALDVVDDADEVLEDLADLAAWVEGFDPRSLLELDYAGLTRVIGRDRLEADRSSHDVWCAVEGLESGDLLAAVAYYAALRSRWGRLRAQLTAS